MSGGQKVAASARVLLSLTPLLPAELHKTILLTSSWPHCHFPKALYFYRAWCLRANSRGLERTRAQRHPKTAASSYYSPLPGPPPFSACQLSQRVQTGLI